MCNEPDCSIAYIIQFQDSHDHYFGFPSLEIIIDHLIHKLVHGDLVAGCSCRRDLQKLKKQIKFERGIQKCCENLEHIEQLIDECFTNRETQLKHKLMECKTRIAIILSWATGNLSENPEIQFPSIINCG